MLICNTEATHEAKEEFALDLKVSDRGGWLDSL